MTFQQGPHRVSPVALRWLTGCEELVLASHGGRSRGSSSADYERESPSQGGDTVDDDGTKLDEEVKPPTVKCHDAEIFIPDRIRRALEEAKSFEEFRQLREFRFAGRRTC